MTATKSTTKKTTTRKTSTKKKITGKRTSSKRHAAKKGGTATPGKKLSALDAAAKVLGEAKKPLGAKQMIERMATKGYWTSPGGKTPSATLYSAILREIQKKGSEARFQKADRGLFRLNTSK